MVGAKTRSRMKHIFIVGNSRSGTTMMLRVMNNHSQVHGINEPHFYGTYWAPADDGRPVDRQAAEKLLERLLTRQRDGFFAEVVAGKYGDDARAIASRLPQQADRKDVYAAFMAHETQRAGKSVVCEKTPQNIFYIAELKRHFPGCKVVVMYRDPRAVLFSQKRKWMRKELGMAGMPDREVRRLRMNYHPYTISRLWNASFDAAKAYRNDADVVHVRFEDLTARPGETMRDLCHAVGLEYEPAMLLVPHAGSSNAMDDLDKKGIRTDRGESWKQGLFPAEVAICQRTSGSRMAHVEYELVPTRASATQILAQWMTFPFKLTGAFLLNLHRMRNLAHTVGRRLKPAT